MSNTKPAPIRSQTLEDEQMLFQMNGINYNIIGGQALDVRRIAASIELVGLATEYGPNLARSQQLLGHSLKQSFSPSGFSYIAGSHPLKIPNSNDSRCLCRLDISRPT